MGLLERADHARQPMNRHTGEGPQAHRTGVGAADIIDQRLQFLLLLQNEPHFWQDHLSHLRQGNAAAAALHQRKAVILLQLAEDVADAGLGGAQGLRRPLQASHLHGFDKCFIFFQAHGSSLISMRIFHLTLYIITEPARKRNHNFAQYRTKVLWAF